MSTAVARECRGGEEGEHRNVLGPHVEQPEVDDSTLSDVVRRPTRTAGDLSEVADASPRITTQEALARDLETVTAEPGAAAERELLADLLRWVERIEK
jgi:hypothetical protein